MASGAERDDDVIGVGPPVVGQHDQGQLVGIGVEADDLRVFFNQGHL